MEKVIKMGKGQTLKGIIDKKKPVKTGEYCVRMWNTDPLCISLIVTTVSGLNNKKRNVPM